MAFFVDEERKFVVFESPKTGGTTLRSWINYAGTGELNLAGNKDYYHESNDVYSRLDEYGYDYSPFQKFEGYEMVCIKREPVSRFISCFTDKIIREGHIVDCDMDLFLNNFDEVLKTHPFEHPSLKGSGIGFLWYHFVPQTYHLGHSADDYTLVVDTKEIGTKLKSYLESKWEIELPDLHTRKQNLPKIQLTDEQTALVKDLYKEDYEAGWS